MEATKRERFVLLGVVPVLSATVGAIITVILQRYLAAPAPTNETVLQILKMPGLSTEDRIKLMEYATRDVDKFYSILSTASIVVLIPLAGILWSYARRIDARS